LGARLRGRRRALVNGGRLAQSHPRPVRHSRVPNAPPERPARLPPNAQYTGDPSCIPVHLTHSCEGAGMTTFPCLVRVATPSGEARYSLGHPLLDRYLESVAGRARPNTLRAVVALRSVAATAIVGAADHHTAGGTGLRRRGPRLRAGRLTLATGPALSPALLVTGCRSRPGIRSRRGRIPPAGRLAMCTCREGCHRCCLG